MRIVSLLPGSTEAVCALGFEKNLVGRSHECDFPATVRRLPACSEPKFNIHGTSREIDERVRKVIEDSLSVYRVDVERLNSLKPDFIITQDQCEVCAVSLKDIQAVVCRMVASKPKIVTLKPESLKDVWTGIIDIARALGDGAKGKHITAQYQKRMDDLGQTARRLKSRPSVACIEWFDPLMAAGNWIPEMLDMLGAVSLFGQAGAHSPKMSWEELKRKDPDVIITMPCGWDMARASSEMKTLTGHPAWSTLKAVKTHQVYLTDGNQYFNRPGPRLVESMEILAEILYPDEFSIRHKGTGWIRSAESQKHL